MTLARLALASLRFYRRPYAAVVIGVASAVAVLAGSFLVGASVRSSLADLATSRTGRTAVVLGTEIPFTAALSDRLAARLAGASVAPLVSLEGVVTHQSSRRRAGSAWDWLAHGSSRATTSAAEGIRSSGSFSIMSAMTSTNSSLTSGLKRRGCQGVSSQ